MTLEQYQKALMLVTTYVADKRCGWHVHEEDHCFAFPKFTIHGDLSDMLALYGELQAADIPVFVGITNVSKKDFSIYISIDYDRDESDLETFRDARRLITAEQEKIVNESRRLADILYKIPEV
jgi:hypothetical protein